MVKVVQYNLSTSLASRVRYKCGAVMVIVSVRFSFVVSLFLSIFSHSNACSSLRRVNVSVFVCGLYPFAPM